MNLEDGNLKEAQLCTHVCVTYTHVFIFVHVQLLLDNRCLHHCKSAVLTKTTDSISTRLKNKYWRGEEEEVDLLD